MIPIAKPIIGPEEKEAVINVLNSGILASGQVVTTFENDFAKYIGSKYAVATSNGTTALHAALKAHEIGPEDEVITSPFTFIATANAIRYVNATPTFVDINPKTYNIDYKQIESKITSKTKAILVVHLFGQPCNMKKLEEIATKHNLVIIEDACQAHGASINNSKIGSKHVACFSFYPTKNMTTGEGGMITTNSEKIAKKLRRIISHGSAKRYHHSEFGHNFRMTNIAAAIGIEQLKKLPLFNQKRRENAEYYTKNLSKTTFLKTPLTHNGHAMHQYTLRINSNNPVNKKRDSLKKYLLSKGISSEVYYPIPIHKQKVFFQYNQESYPNSEIASKEVLSIPNHPSINLNEREFITKTIIEWDQLLQ